MCLTLLRRFLDHDFFLSVTRNTGKYMEDVYFVPWCRVGPYAVGLLLGYILHTTRCRYTMTKVRDDEFLDFNVLSTIQLSQE